jgi:ubiquinone/menaquinone biosynthesis C-methylase UbiE
MPEARSTASYMVDNGTLTGMAMGYFRSRVLSSAARLGVADALGGDERTIDELASLCHAESGSLYRLLRALASFGVVAETAPGRFVLTQFGEPLRKDAPNSEWPAVVFWADLLSDNWSYLTECVRSGENAAGIMQREGVVSRWSKDPYANDVFRAVMGTAPAEDYMSIARAWDFSRYSTVADLGGGGGALIAAVLEAFPTLYGMLVDRPESIDRAKPRFEVDGPATRCTLQAADLSAAVPTGADVYMMKHVLHGYDDEAAINILRNCRSVLPEQGRVLIIEFVLPNIVDRADLALEHRLMSDLNMLAVTGGKERNAAEWEVLLKRSGFACQSIIPVAGELVSIIEAAGVH